MEDNNDIEFKYSINGELLKGSYSISCIHDKYEAHSCCQGFGYPLNDLNEVDKYIDNLLKEMKNKVGIKGYHIIINNLENGKIIEEYDLKNQYYTDLSKCSQDILKKVWDMEHDNFNDNSLIDDDNQNENFRRILSVIDIKNELNNNKITKYDAFNKLKEFSRGCL